ncbi:MAG TPA: hypothetical protein VFS09_02585 [Candidatus Eisenbacteria bacterium]|nr:hypothetical protein [Candidatus Eisenbacteria bacterium]
MIRRLSLPLLSLLLAASLLAVPAHAGKSKVPRGKTWRVDFRSDTLGIAPTGSIVMAGSWAVLEDSSAAAATGGADGGSADSARALPRVLRQRSDDEAVASNWIRFAKPTLETCEISVRFRILSGELDPSVGIVFHFDPKRKNGYLVRISGRTEEMIAHYLLSGKRRDIKFQKMTPPALGEWHTLGVRREGIRISVLYDGKEMMALREERFASGTVGLWTEDDTVADFADLTITAR